MSYKAFTDKSSKRRPVGIRMKKRRTTIYIDVGVWEKFMKYLIEKHGKTHGGVISAEIEKALLAFIKK